MSDETPNKYAFKVDARDVLGGSGALLVLAGAASFHWGAAVAVLGFGLCALAYRLAR